MAGTVATIAAGLALFGYLKKWDWALGFVSGTLVSLGSFRLIVASVARFTEDPGSQARGRRSWWFWSLIRLLGAACALFLVVFYLPVNLIGVALGLLAVQLGMGAYLIVQWSWPQSGNLRTEDRKP